MARCRNLSSECCLEEVFRKSPHLEVVDMSGVTTVNDRTLLVLLEYCTEVQQVFIEGCTKVTHQPLHHPKSSKVNFDVLHQEEITPEQSNRTMKILGQI